MNDEKLIELLKEMAQQLVNVLKGNNALLEENLKLIKQNTELTKKLCQEMN